MIIENTEHKLTKEEIDSKVRQLFVELYDACYTENLVISKLYPEGYKVSIPLHNSETPFVVAIEADGETFFQYLKKALQESSLGSVKFSTLSKTMEHPNPVNENIKGDFSNQHRVASDNIVYISENSNT